MNAIDKIEADYSTEEKIKEAARKLFTQKGYDAVKTRDIASEAGINLALLNYYFRSKEKLFDLVRLENLQEFVHRINAMLDDENATFEDVIGSLVISYIDWMSENPDPPFFLINELKKLSKDTDKHIDAMIPEKAVIRKKLKKILKDRGMTPEETFHFASNLVGMIITPFFMRHVLESLNDVSDKHFNKMIEERKRLIPLWLKAMKDIK